MAESKHRLLGAASEMRTATVREAWKGEVLRQGGRQQTVVVVGKYATRRRHARTLERLIRSDPQYGWYGDRPHPDRSLNGALIKRRIGKKRIWVAEPGTAFRLWLTPQRRQELQSVERLIDVAVPVQPRVPRYLVRFPESSVMLAAAKESPWLRIPVMSPKRALMSVDRPSPHSDSIQARDEAQKLAKTLQHWEQHFRAEVAEEVQYYPDDVIRFGPDNGGGSLDDVLVRIKVPPVWTQFTGAGVSIAIIDSGINGQRDEFPLARRRGEWAPNGWNAWEDPLGHGSMCACVATAKRQGNSEFTGVAPDAGLYSCRTTLNTLELILIYDYLAEQARLTGERIVANNCFGYQQGTPPANDPYLPDLLLAIDQAVETGVVPVFSAGNNHHLAEGGPHHCRPNTIWSFKSLEHVVTVAASRLDDDQMWHYSSRGPGEWHGKPRSSVAKPDITAPSPPSGKILYGDTVRFLVDGWGTSGSAAQISGLVALLLCKNPTATIAEIHAAIGTTASDLRHKPSCQGSGLVDCEAAVATI